LIVNLAHNQTIINWNRFHFGKSLWNAVAVPVTLPAIVIGDSIGRYQINVQNSVWTLQHLNANRGDTTRHNNPPSKF